MPSSPRTTALGAYLEGWRRTLHAPHLIVGVFLATIAVSLPLALGLGGAISASLGSSLSAEDALDGWNAEWIEEFTAGRVDVGATFTHEILGFGGTLAVLDRLVNGREVPRPLVGGVAVYLLFSIVLSGGVLDRLARARPLGLETFLATCGRFAPRLVRFALIAGAGYWALFRWIHPLIFDAALPWLAGAAPSDARLFVLQLASYAVFLAIFGGFTLLADLSRVRLVVEDRLSAVAAWTAGWRFVRRRPGRLVWLLLLNVIGQIIIGRLWLQTAPGPASADWLAVGVMEVYLIARLAARLAFMASEVVFFQGELAHATYAAPPLPKWPDSASVEAIRNLGQAR